MAAAILAADQATKALCLNVLTPGQSVPLLPSVLHLTYVQNTGAAFGLGQGQQRLFIGFSLGVIGWLCYELRRPGPLPTLLVWGSALVLGGAAGNLIDRLRWGFVVDFIDLRVWPVFNLGDSAITIGVALLLWQSLFRNRPAPPPAI